MIAATSVVSAGVWYTRSVASPMSGASDRIVSRTTVWVPAQKPPRLVASMPITAPPNANRARSSARASGEKRSTDARPTHGEYHGYRALTRFSLAICCGLAPSPNEDPPRWKVKTSSAQMWRKPTCTARCERSTSSPYPVLNAMSKSPTRSRSARLT